MNKARGILRLVAVLFFLLVSAENAFQAQQVASKRQRKDNSTGNVAVPRDSVASQHVGSEELIAMPFDTLLHTGNAVADSIARENKKKIAALTQHADSLSISLDDSLAVRRKQWIPNPTRATWLALVIPGGGQIYNRKYWKLPIVYGGFAGCAYALTWNNRMYKDYMQAYKDAVNEHWDSSSITDLLPAGYLERVSTTQLTDILRKRKDSYRRYRDLSIFAFVGVYLISVVDAYVDAELSNFDITPDLSMRVEPAIFDDPRSRSRLSKKSVGLQCSFRF